MPERARRSIAIVGGSLAGLHAAKTLRAEGFAGRVVMIGDEPHLPYDRPPLSKELLQGKWTADQTRLPCDPDETAVEWWIGRRAVGLEADKLAIELDDGGRERFAGIVIATGAAPRTFGSMSLPGVHVLRTLDDSVALAADLASRPAHVAIIGGGFIGAEVASVCWQLGIASTVIEALDVPLERPLGREIATIVAALHGQHGVVLRTSVGVVGFEGDGRVQRVRLSDGDAIAADVVVVAIGVEPATGWLERSGLRLDDGVVCDETCLAAPGIVAAGDVARWPNRRCGTFRRVEHWDNAIRQGEHAARRLLDEWREDATPRPYEPVPWFWTEQYGLKMQMLGSTDEHDAVEIVSGSPEEDRFVALYRCGDRLAAALGVRSARAVNECRRLLNERATWTEALDHFATRPVPVGTARRA